MRVLEFEAKALLTKQGLPLPQGQAAASPAETTAAAQTIGGAVVVKAQIPTGGRMKAGGIRFSGTPAEAETAAGTLLDSEICGFRVERVLVEADRRGVSAFVPRPGQSLEPERLPPNDRWWPELPWEGVDVHPIVATKVPSE